MVQNYPKKIRRGLTYASRKYDKNQGFWIGFSLRPSINLDRIAN